MKLKTIATILARGGSAGLPGKNIRAFAGRPLIVHSIQQARRCEEIAGVYVSTDDLEIADIARSAGALVPFLLPAEMTSDTVPKLPVIEHLVRHLEAEGMHIGRIVDLQPTSPLRTTHDIHVALNSHPAADLVASVTRTHANPYFNLVESQPDGTVRPSKGDGNVLSEDNQEVYSLNGSIYVWRREALTKAVKDGMWSVNIATYVMPRWRSLDIVDFDDFDHAEWLHTRYVAD